MEVCVRVQRSLVIILVLLGSVATIGFVGCRQTTEDSGEIVIAAVAPTTGKWGEMGNDLLAAVKLAVEERNAAGGIDGKQVRLLTEDDKASPRDAVTIAHMLVANRSVIGMVGHMNSGTTLAASPVYADAGLPVVMPVPTNPQITQQGFHDLFRIPVTDDKQGPTCINFMVDKLGKKTIAIVHSKDAYGEGIATEARKAVEARGLEPVAFLGINADDQDFRAVATQLKRLNPDSVFFGGGHSEAALLIKQSREQGFDAVYVMGDGCFDSQLMAIAGSAADGSYVSNIAPTSAPGQRAEAFFTKFLQRQGKIVAFAPLGYVAANVLLDAIDKAPDKTREGVRMVLNNPSFNYESILGKISFEPNGDSKEQRTFMHKIENGKFVTVAQ